MYSCEYTWIPLTTSKMKKYFYDHYNEFEYNHDFLKDSYSSKYNNIIDSIYIYSNTCMNNFTI